jgi:RNA polymerase sigma-70 factor (ECF subfamily)
MDLLQSFFVHVLEKGSLRRADPARGRFRTFLLTSLKNFAENERQRLSARKRGGGVPLLSLELQDAERRFQIDPPTFETPERLFDRQWALALLDRVMHRLQAELPANRARAFEHLRPYLTGEEPAPSYAQTAALFGSSESALKVAVHRLRRRFRDLVHEEIAHTVSGPDEIARELKHLWSAVRR